MRLKFYGCSALLGIILLTVHQTAAAETVACLQPLPNSQQVQMLGDLLMLSLSCNPNTRSAWAQMQAAEANVGIVESSYWPQISTQYNATQAYASTAAITTAAPTNVSRLSYGPTLSLSYLVWDFGNLDQRAKVARWQWLASKFNRDLTVQQTLLQVTQTYYQELATKELLRAAQLNFKEDKVALRAAKMLHQQGMATIGDVYQAQSVAAQANTALQQADGNYRIAKGQLNNAIGIPVMTELTLTKLASPTEVQPVMHSVKRLLSYANQHRPDLLAAKAQLAASQAQLAATRSLAYPTIQLSATAGQTFPTYANTSGFARNVMVSVSVPLFVGFAQIYGIKQAEANLQQIEATKDNLINQIALQVWQADINLETAVKTLTSTNQALISSQQAARQAQGQYRAGVGNILTVLTAQAALAASRAQLIQAQFNWHASLAQLDTALGNYAGNESTGKQTNAQFKEFN